MIFLVLSEKMIFLFPKIWSYSLDTEGKIIFLKKNKKNTWKYHIFFRCSEKMVFLKNSRLNMKFWKDGISFFQKTWYFFFRRKMKEDNLYQKKRGNMIFSVYMRRRYRRDIAHLSKKERCPEKIHLRVTSPASPKKMIFILDPSYFCWNITFIDLWKGPKK